ncbi:putative esterase [Rhodococcus opacus B4]|uniref:Putative esterase n=2 Tax=Rhodococcus opacus TaxID=37919 RepID=C1AVG5_RHOOB|nr:putative esterase [Rhodococcus opacus B4]
MTWKGIFMNDVQVQSNLRVAEVDGFEIAVDLYRPDIDNPPAVIYLHGGGWQLGDKKDGADDRLARLASYGVAVVSANYRLAPQGLYPNPIHDVKAVVRWLRAHGAELGVSTDRIGVWGASAGAYLATMVGLTPGDEELEGVVGDDLDQSSRVDAVVHWFGPSDLAANAGRSWIESHLLPPPFENALLGEDEVSAPSDISWNASPLSRVTSLAPPFLIAHGDRDRITLSAQSHALHDALVSTGARSTLLVLGGAGHEGPEFDQPDHLGITAAFLSAHLRG